MTAHLSLYAYDRLVLAGDFLQLLYQLLQVLYAPSGEILFYEILFGFTLGRFTKLLQIGFQSRQQCRRRFSRTSPSTSCTCWRCWVFTFLLLA